MTLVASGNGGLTYDEAKSHFTAWALMKSPLLVSYSFASIYWLTHPHPDRN